MNLAYSAMPYRQETINPYHEGEKAKQVEQMFNRLAPNYDAFNHRMSWTIDRRWRKRAIRQLAPYRPLSILDVATGTGDFAIMAAELLQCDDVTGVDISEGMLEIAKKKMFERGLQLGMDFEKQDCLNLDEPDNCYDAVISAFGIRNFADLDQGLREMYRVMKKGGHLSIVELTTPVKFPMKQLFRIYSHTILPLYGRLISRDANAFSYLTKTLEAFPQGEEMVGILRKAGFKDTSFKRMTFGICTMYFATK